MGSPDFSLFLSMLSILHIFSNYHFTSFLLSKHLYFTCINLNLVLFIHSVSLSSTHPSCCTSVIMSRVCSGFQVVFQTVSETVSTKSFLWLRRRGGWWSSRYIRSSTAEPTGDKREFKHAQNAICYFIHHLIHHTNPYSIHPWVCFHLKHPLF